jgi:hypothetical protein
MKPSHAVLPFSADTFHLQVAAPKKTKTTEKKTTVTKKK